MKKVPTLSIIFLTGSMILFFLSLTNFNQLTHPRQVIYPTLSDTSSDSLQTISKKLNRDITPTPITSSQQLQEQLKILDAITPASSSALNQINAEIQQFTH